MLLRSQIDTFTETGLQLKSGEHLDDIIVTATGLVLKLMSGLQLMVDGAPVDLSKTITYKGMMYSDVPNLVSAFGYTNASVEMRPHGRLCLPAPETHGPAWLRAVHPTPERRRAHGSARNRLHFRLRPAGTPHPAATGIENAVVQNWPEGLKPRGGSLHRHTSFIRNRKSTAIQPDQAVCHNDQCRSGCNPTSIPSIPKRIAPNLV